MNGFNFEAARESLHQFKFQELFIHHLGWENPTGIHTLQMKIDEIDFTARPISNLSGVAVFEIENPAGFIPDKETQKKVHNEISKLYHENLLLFLDTGRTQSQWLWLKRDGNKKIFRDHLYMKGQPGDLFLNKLSAMFVDISEFNEQGHLPIIEASAKIAKALDVEKTTKDFYSGYDQERLELVDLIEGIDDEKDRRWYASVLLNRLMFIYFLQQKGFLDNEDREYLQNKLAQYEGQGNYHFYNNFLKVLFFEGFAKPEGKRTPEVNRILGTIRYLNGGLFLPHQLEEKWSQIRIPNQAFANIFKLFTHFTWNLDDRPGGKDNELNPDVLGFIFEKYINQKAFGAYYTRPEITEYLCERTIYQVLLEKINTPEIPGVLPARAFDSIDEMLLKADAPLCRELLVNVLPKISLLDPACGSGAFLVAAMKTLINVYSAVIGKIEFLNDPQLNAWLKSVQKDHASISYYIKRQIITNNLYGVDIMPEAAEIAKLRLFLALVSSVEKVEQLEPLPNIDFNILTGDSLIGLLRVDEEAFNRKLNPGAQLQQANLLPQFKQTGLFQKSYRQLVDEKQRQLDTYRHATHYTEDLQSLRDEIEKNRQEAYRSLNDLLLNDFSRLEIKFEQATWDEKANREGKPIRRAVRLSDIEALSPFHWGYEFDEVMNSHGGFDAIITNPPWDIFKPNGKEFFLGYSDLVKKKKMMIHDFEKEMDQLLQNYEIRQEWLKYESTFPYQSQYFRYSDPFKNQISVIDGKKTGSDVNLYKLFVEQCFNLLRENGLCGMVIPSGIHTDLGTLQLRRLLFENTRVTGLFGFENRKAIFDGVHKSFKFDILTYQKGGLTKEFPAAFMRHEVSELATFPAQRGMAIPVSLIKRLSPDSWSVMEFKEEIDQQIAEKMLQFPLLGEEVDGKTRVELTREFDMTQKKYSKFVRTIPGKEDLPLFEGKMIWQFIWNYAKPHFFVNYAQLKKVLYSNLLEKNLPLSCNTYRLVFRRQSASTNERTLVSTILPACIHADNLASYSLFDGDGKAIISSAEQIFHCALYNSYLLDYSIRQRVTTNLNFFYLYQLPIPIYCSTDRITKEINNISARLICVSNDFDELAKSAGLRGCQDGVIDPQQRAQLRAELDARVAHLYGLDEEEFAHVLSTFPIVREEVKQAAMREFLKG
jgi:hypothetical protein